MSQLIISISDLPRHHIPNQHLKVRIIGTILEFNPAAKHILIRPSNLLTDDKTPIKLELLDDLPIGTDPQLAYSGVLVDVCGLYDGEGVKLLKIDVLDDVNLLMQNREVFEMMANLKPLTEDMVRR